MAVGSWETQKWDNRAWTFCRNRAISRRGMAAFPAADTAGAGVTDAADEVEDEDADADPAPQADPLVSVVDE